MEQTETQSSINVWEKELQELEEQKEFYKPAAGTHAIDITSNPTKKQFVDPETGEVKEQIQLEIKTTEGEYIWTITKGRTPASLYGQLLKAAEQNNWEWTTLKIEVNVKVAGQMPNGSPKRDYFVKKI